MAGVGSHELCPSFGPWLNPASTQGICKLYIVYAVRSFVCYHISNNAVNIYISYCCFIDRPALPQGIANLVWT